MLLALEGDYGRKVASGIASFAQTQPDWVLELLNPDPSSAFSASTLAAGRCSGLVVQANAEAWIRDVRRYRAPTVNVGPVWPETDPPRVGVNNVQAGALAAIHLVELGLKEFAFVGMSRLSFAEERLTGFRDELGSHNFTATLCPERALGSEELLAGWLERLPAPTGIYSCSDSWGYRVLCACKLAGLEVPQQAAVVGTDNDEALCRWSNPALSSIPVRAEQIGYEAAALLDALLHGKPADQTVLLQPAPVVVRGSTNQYYVDDPHVAAAFAFMRDRFSSGIGVHDVLQAVPLSRRRLEQKFRAALGVSPGKVLKDLRLRRIRTLLTETDLSMKEIASQVGYATQQHMSNVFREAEGQSPARYRALQHRPPR
jgi:LacI family transcriptional regulator